MLTGEEIIKQIEEGNIVIVPFDKENINPNSYNITLSDELYVYEDKELDPFKENKTKLIKIPKTGYTLVPGELYLAKTNEYTETNNYIPQLDGRSSIGRIGINTHTSSGYGSLGFKGKWVLTVQVTMPVKIYPDIEIGQISYYPAVGKIEKLYTGRYNNEDGIVSSKIHLDSK